METLIELLIDGSKELFLEDVPLSKLTILSLLTLSFLCFFLFFLISP